MIVDGQKTNMNDSHDLPESTASAEQVPAEGAAGPARVVWANVLHDRAHLSESRRDATLALEQAGRTGAIVADVALAMTELVVNALTHGTASTVEVTVSTTHRREEIILVVRHEDGGSDHLTDPPQMAAPGQLHGRGRAIVAAIADQFDTVRHGEREVEHTARFVI